jgi:hypothetical protein
MSRATPSSRAAVSAFSRFPRSIARENRPYAVPGSSWRKPPGPRPRQTLSLRLGRYYARARGRLRVGYYRIHPGCGRFLRREDAEAALAGASLDVL